MRFKLGLVLVAALVAVAVTCSFAEVPNRSPEQLKNTATHIITAEVSRIYQRQSKEGMRTVTRYLAEVRVKSVEKGEGIQPDSLLYVRYFTQANPPGVTDTAGHRGLPAEGQRVRIYLARNA